MAYVIKTTHLFEKSLDRCVRRGLPMGEFMQVVRILEKEGKLPRKYKPHKLTGVDSGSAISVPIGRLSGRRMIGN